MALQLPIIVRGGFDAPEGYRRAAMLQVEFVQRTISTGAIDYKDKATREADQNNVLGQQAYQAQAFAQPREQYPMGRNPDGSLNLAWREGTPSYTDFLGKPVSDYIEIKPETTAEDVLKAIAYAHMKTAEANAKAADV